MNGGRGQCGALPLQDAGSLKGDALAVGDMEGGTNERQASVVAHGQIAHQLVSLTVRTGAQDDVLTGGNRPVTLGNDGHLNRLSVLTAVQGHANTRAQERDVHQ